MILTIRTDNPQAEIGLFHDGEQVAYKKWEAHRELSATILQVIHDLLESQDCGWGDIRGVLYYEGPGSFTGLRIGASVANAIATSNSIPVANATGSDWLQDGIALLENDEGSVALPACGSDPHITAQKK